MAAGKRTRLGAVSAFCQARRAPLLVDPQLDLEAAHRGLVDRKSIFTHLETLSPTQLPSSNMFFGLFCWKREFPMALSSSQKKLVKMMRTETEGSSEQSPSGLEVGRRQQGQGHSTEPTTSHSSQSAGGTLPTLRRLQVMTRLHCQPGHPTGGSP